MPPQNPFEVAARQVPEVDFAVDPTERHPRTVVANGDRGEARWTRLRFADDATGCRIPQPQPFIRPIAAEQNAIVRAEREHRAAACRHRLAASDGIDLDLAL